MKKIITAIYFVVIMTSLLFSQSKESTMGYANKFLEDENLPEEIRIKLKGIFQPTTINITDSTRLSIKNYTKSNIALKSAKQNGTNSKKLSKTSNLIKSLNEQTSSHYREKLDSIEYFETVSVPTYDSLNTVINEYKTDENGFKIEHIQKVLNESTGELNFNTKETTVNNENGKPLEIINMEWNSVEWQKKTKKDFEYDTNWDLINELQYNWNSIDGNWLLAKKYETQYDEKNRWSGYVFYDVLNVGEDIYSSKFEMTFTENGDVASYSYLSTWNVNLNTWTIQEKSQSEYNDTGNLTTVNDSIFNIERNKWEISYKYEYEYFDDGSYVERKYQWISNFNELYLVSNTKYEKLYDGKKLLQSISFSLVGNEWKYEWKNEYKYDQWGNQIFHAAYEYFGDDYSELRAKSIREFSESGQILKNEEYSWDDRYYTLRGTSYYEYQTDESGNISKFISYKWDENEQKWLVASKDFYSYSDEGTSEVKTFEFNKNGTKSWFEKESTAILTYDSEIGKYTGLKEYDYEFIIIYNEDLKVKELFENDIADSEGNYDYSKTECYYDELGRDTARYDYGTVDGQLELFAKKLFAYKNEPGGYFKVTELNIELGRVNDYIDRRIDYYYKNDKLMSVAVRWDNGDGISGLVLGDSTVYSYNNAGQLVLLLGETGYSHYKTEYSFQNDTLTISDYEEYIDEANGWNLNSKSVIEIDKNFSKDQLQQIPSIIFDDDVYEYEFYSNFDYGKVISSVDYEYYNSSPWYTSKSLFYYSPTSSLSGDAVIRGNIYEETGTEKSISISEANGVPIEGVVVSLLDLADDFLLAKDTTSADGFYEFQKIPVGRYYLKVELEGYPQLSTYEIEVNRYLTVFENKDFIVKNGELVTNLEEFGMDLKIYPNPATNFIYINSTKKINSLKFIDFGGKLRLLFEGSDLQNLSIPINKLIDGIYIIEMGTESGVYHQKVVVQNQRYE